MPNDPIQSLNLFFSWNFRLLSNTFSSFFVFCVSVQVKLTVPLLCLCAFCLERLSPKWCILFRVGC